MYLSTGEGEVPVSCEGLGRGERDVAVVDGCYSEADVAAYYEDG